MANITLHRIYGHLSIKNFSLVARDGLCITGDGLCFRRDNLSIKSGGLCITKVGLCITSSGLENKLYKILSF
jgi:hypothetical protein